MLFDSNAKSLLFSTGSQSRYIGKGREPKTFLFPSNAGIKPIASVKPSLLALGGFAVELKRPVHVVITTLRQILVNAFFEGLPCLVPLEYCWCFFGDRPVGQVWLLHFVFYIILGGSTQEDRASSQILVPPANFFPPDLFSHGRFRILAA